MPDGPYSVEVEQATEMDNRAGTGRAVMNVGWMNNNTGANPTILADFAGHDADLLLSSLNIGGRIGNNGTTVTATVNFSSGVLDATTINVADRRNTGADGQTGTSNGTLNLSGGTVLIGATGLNIAANTSTNATQTSAGTVNISGGNVTIRGPVTLGGSTNTNGTSVAQLNITGGTVDIRNSIAKGVGDGFTSVTSTLRLANATLDLNGFTIGTLSRPINNMLLESGTLQNVTEINGGGAIGKTTAGTLVLDGFNTFSGVFTIAAGTLQVGTGANTGTLGTGAIINSASLVINRAGT
jgi:autotransporter-associated beta strand protein